MGTGVRQGSDPTLPYPTASARRSRCALPGRPAREPNRVTSSVPVGDAKQCPVPASRPAGRGVASQLGRGSPSTALTVLRTSRTPRLVCKHCQRDLPQPALAAAPARRSKAKGKILLIVAALIVCYAIVLVYFASLPKVASSAKQEKAPVPFTLTGHQGIVYFVVVSPDVAKSEDNLWRIAEDPLREQRTGAVQAMFWTQELEAPASLPMNDAQVAKQVAQININNRTAFRELPAEWSSLHALATQLCRPLPKVENPHEEVPVLCRGDSGRSHRLQTLWSRSRVSGNTTTTTGPRTRPQDWRERRLSEVREDGDRGRQHVSTLRRGLRNRSVTTARRSTALDDQGAAG